MGELSRPSLDRSRDGLAVTRGIEVGIGNPNQIFAFRPASTINNTRIYNVLDCGSIANTSCVGGKGGVFDSSKSSTYRISIKDRWNGSEADAETAAGAYVYFNDEIDFQENGTVEGFPLVMDSELGQGAQSGLPLGLVSSFLEAAVAADVAPSKAWGLWTGSRSLDPADGKLVVGGYDKSRLDGHFTTFPMGNWSLNRPCPLQITVTNITYNYPGGSQSLFSNSSQNMPACVEPFQHSFSFPPDITQNFASITGYNSSYPALTYPASSPPTGNLTITLEHGYKTTIPNYELITLKRGSDKNGRYAITNTSIVETRLANNLEADPSDVLPILGGAYLTFNYLVVDYEQGIFRMAPAKQGQALDGTANIKALCTPSPSPSPSPTVAAPAATSSTAPAKHTSVGVIAGGVVGGVLGLALIAGLIALFFLSKRRKIAKESSGEPSIHHVPSEHPPPSFTSSGQQSTSKLGTNTEVTEVIELPSPDHHVSHQLFMQQHHGDVKEAGIGGVTEAVEVPMSARISTPVEMPAFPIEPSYQTESKISPQPTQDDVPRANSIPRKPVRANSISRFLNYGQPN